MESVIKLWQRIEQWLATHAPKILDTLNPGASEEELVLTETALGVTLPEDFKASYRLHNGGFLLPPRGQKTLTLAEIVEIWEMFQGANETFSDEPPGPVQPLFWHPKWIPFLWGGYGSEYVCLDLAPGPGGQVGQIILRTHGMEPPTLIAASFETLVADAADHLEAGAYVYIAAANGLVFFNNLGNWDIES